MSTITEVLRDESTTIPDCLRNAELLNQVTLTNFLSSRTVFYPGSGNDGQAIRLFGSAHAACCYVHADYGVDAREIEQRLDSSHPHHIKGYRPVHIQLLSPSEFASCLPAGAQGDWGDGSRSATSILWSILDREPEFGQDHGPERLAFLHLCADGVWTYRTLWGSEHRTAPLAVVLQDNGFGGNWTVFGSGQSQIYRIAQRFGLPRWLLVAENTTPWPGYEVQSDPDPGGMHNHGRRLWRLAPAETVFA